MRGVAFVAHETGIASLLKDHTMLLPELNNAAVFSEG